MRWRERDGVHWLEAELPGARAAFTSRQGGVSEGEFAALNLGLLTGDGEGAVRENRARAAAALELDPGSVLLGRQVHGTEVMVSDAAPRPSHYEGRAAGPPPELDGQATARPGLAPLVLVADCLPVALHGPGGVAMIHCGWRGLAGGIVERGVDAVGASAAAIGPGIGPCCYEVGPEVLAAFDGLPEAVASGRMLDLPAVARSLLARAGVGEVAEAELCTSCEPELFFSHRRDRGSTGRQGGFAWIDDG